LKEVFENRIKFSLRILENKFKMIQGEEIIVFKVQPSVPLEPFKSSCLLAHKNIQVTGKLE
jgi:hypothetical protein